MSKQSENKEKQGYTMKQGTCGNCRYYTSEMKEHKDFYGQNWKEEKSKRCAIGGFAVKKTGVCNLFCKVA